ncbi:MAG TPA: PepSY-associated TM helix domain-containing protein [Prolixibacteraceae bacterium]|nr:PepSY-associated TM helix domain-containing protein [Prolixibacteraceae bacterium]
MNKNAILRKLRKFHKWPGIVITLFVILFSLSGILMNHRELISSIDIKRSLLPTEYSYENWNKGAVKSVFRLSGDSTLVYGNIGVWLSTDHCQTFQDWNTGFPKGSDNRKVNKILKTPNGKLFAGTYFGLFQYSHSAHRWIKTELPVSEERITDLILKQNELLVQTRSFLLKSSDGVSFYPLVIPAPEGYDGKASLFKTLWLLHSGEIWGSVGKLIVDLFGLVILLISFTGLLHFIFPGWLKRRRERKKDNSKLASARNFNLKWHNRLGWIFIPFLIFVSITGMFLRPPLLIAIGNATVSPIPGTILSSPNPWYDKLRRVLYDEQQHIFMFSTYDGIFFTDENLKEPMRRLPGEPPVSVMGCNVLEKKGESTYLIGSFNGLFLWEPLTGQVFDYLSGSPYQAPQVAGPPVSKDMIDGWFSDSSGKEFYFDYNHGVLPIRNTTSFGAMSAEIIQESPISLWNLSLEIHTGRIFEPILGMFYILYVPLAGLCILIVLISGFFIWWIGYRKTKLSQRREGTK